MFTIQSVTLIINEGVLLMVELPCYINYNVQSIYLNKKNAYIVKGNIENILHKRRYYNTNVHLYIGYTTQYNENYISEEKTTIVK